MRNTNRGFVLLEVLVALLILGTGATTIVGCLLEISRTESSSSDAERSVRDASRMLAALSLLSRGDLEERLGRRRAGDLEVTITRSTAGLYEIIVMSPGGVLETRVYRPA